MNPFQSRSELKGRIRWTVKLRIYYMIRVLFSYRKSAFVLVVCNFVLFGCVWWKPTTKGISIQDAHQFEFNSPLIKQILSRSYFPNLLPSNGFCSLGEEYDPRLMPALWLNYVHQILDNDGFSLESDIPFSWSSWLDLELGMIKSSCATFAKTSNIKHLLNFTQSCTNLVDTIKVTGPVDVPMSEEARRIVGANYLVHAAPVPQRIMFLGVPGHSVGLLTPVLQSKLIDKQDLKHLLRIYELSSENSEYIEIGQVFDKLKCFLILMTSSASFIKTKSLNYDILRTLGPINSRAMEKQDFEFDFQAFYALLKQRVNKSNKQSRINNFDSRLLFNIRNSIDKDHQFSKYFHEAIVTDDMRGTHYDWRFFKSLDHSDYEKKAILHRLTRAWLRFASTIGIHTWLAHGSLLGWYWNGMTMPWDLDLDVQVTMKSLIHLARNYNQTLIVDLDSDQNVNLGVGSYLLDIGPGFFSRELGNGLNAIDARLIDTVSGFYVDITALALTNEVEDFEVGSKQATEFSQVLDPEYITKDRSHTIRNDDLQRELEVAKHELLNSHSLFKCKNNHFFTWEDLHPLRKSMFEGITAWVPNEFKNILKREYSHGLYSRQHEGHTYRPVLDLWVPNNVCRKDSIGNNCFDEKTLLETKYTKPITSKHRTEIVKKEWKYGEELSPIRIDPWLISRAQRILQIIKKN